MGAKIQRKKNVSHILREYIEVIVVAFILALLIRVFVVSAYRVPTVAMTPNLLPGDFIFANKLAFGLFSKQAPKRGDVVIFECPGDNTVKCLKRVVALGGDTLQIEQGELVVNGVSADYEDLDSKNFSDLFGYEQFTFKNEIFEGHRHKIIYSKSIEEPLNYGPVVVPDDKIFLLGDNRSKSEDSRSWGPVSIEAVTSQPVTIWMSLDWENPWLNGKLPSVRWERLFSRL